MDEAAEFVSSVEPFVGNMFCTRSFHDDLAELPVEFVILLAHGQIFVRH